MKESRVIILPPIILLGCIVYLIYIGYIMHSNLDAKAERISEFKAKGGLR